MWTIGSIVFSVGVGIKMSLLPALPGVIMILGQAMTVQRAVHMLFIMGQVQVSDFYVQVEVCTFENGLVADSGGHQL